MFDFTSSCISFSVTNNLAHMPSMHCPLQMFAHGKIRNLYDFPVTLVGTAVKPADFFGSVVEHVRYSSFQRLFAIIYFCTEDVFSTLVM